MKYVEVTVKSNTYGSELIADIFWQYTSEGVAVYDVSDIINLSKDKNVVWDYMDEDILKSDGSVLCKGYVKSEEEWKILEIEKKLENLKNTSEIPVGSLEVVKREVEGDEWLEKWKEYFKPIKIDGVVICPAWIKYKEKKGEKVVFIDSNMAFGTGEHETTSTCIEFLQQYVNKDKKVIDVGCGSGILGITAEKLGAKSVLMTDIDLEAIKATERNMKINKTKNAVVKCENLLDGETVTADIVVANIMAEILVGFAKGIKRNVEEGGIIILSGILTEKRDMVLSAYESAGFVFLGEIKKGGWVTLSMKKGGESL